MVRQVTQIRLRLRLAQGTAVAFFRLVRLRRRCRQFLRIRDMKKLITTIGVASILQGAVLAEHHAKGQAAKDIEEVTSTVMQMYELVNNKKHWHPMNSSKGSHQFWSSGGLLNFVSGDQERDLPAIESNTVRPKHLTVIPVEPGKVAVAMFYAEGSEKVAGRPPVDHYMTRATIVFVKEKDGWRFRVMHWSPIAGGQGTSNISIKK